MSSADILRSMVDYDAWANDRVLAAAERLTPEQLADTPSSGYPSILTNLTHILATKAMYLSVWKGEPPHPIALAAPPATLAPLREATPQVHEAFAAYVTSLSEAALGREVEYGRFRLPLGDQAVQVLLHGQHHRSEAAMLLTSWGESPGNMDYLFFALERSGQLR